MSRKFTVLDQPATDYSAIYEHLDCLRGRAFALARNAADASDLVQDTLLRAIRNPEPVPAGPALRNWLMRVMFNLFIDHCRRRSRQMALSSIDVVEIAAPPEYTPCDWEQISNDDVNNAMSRLEQPFSDVLRLRHQEGRSYREISEMLAIPEATVGTRLLRARRKVRRILQPVGPGQVPEMLG
ncbi:MAG: RNA polymerase sigma factor [Deltaproteobacteria bacterium]|nr:RNA polymerase sigma factor [Deltaproteobacteria bacterium]